MSARNSLRASEAKSKINGAKVQAALIRRNTGSELEAGGFLAPGDQSCVDELRAPCASLVFVLRTSSSADPIPSSASRLSLSIPSHDPAGL